MTDEPSLRGDGVSLAIGSKPSAERPDVLSGVSYVLPLRLDHAANEEMTAYLRWLSERLEVVVADGSPPPVFEYHRDAWSGFLTHLPVKSTRLNGKVAGVIDGLAVASGDLVVIADDDIRYDDETLRRLVERLDTAAAVVPQNYFFPLPWHARWDTGRSLLNRAFGHDYAGTVAMRRSFLPAGEYCGAVLFENLELLRTISASGGHLRHERGLYVRRQPPSAEHFRRQRVRQAFDSFAQPGRFAVELAVLPLTLWAARRPAGRRTAVAAGVSLVAAAEVGRRRDGGTRVFSPAAALWAPVWAAERAVCSWAAVAWRLRGGVPYAGQRLKVSAHRERDLAVAGCPESECLCRLRPAAS